VWLDRFAAKLTGCQFSCGNADADRIGISQTRCFSRRFLGFLPCQRGFYCQQGVIRLIERGVKVAITLSPMNLSNVPSKRNTVSVIAVKYSLTNQPGLLDQFFGESS